MKEFQLYTMPEYHLQLEAFAEIYDIEIIDSNLNRPSILKPKNERVCRFCGLKKPDTSFKKKAHIIPYFLGNENKLYDTECDKCNELFGKYENDLANYLGVERSLNGSTSRAGTPTQKSFIHKTELRGENILGIDGVLAQKTDMDSSAFKLEDSEDGKTQIGKISFTKKPYTPINVYKALLKIAFSILPQTELMNYKVALTYLLDNDNKQLCNLEKVHFFTFEIGLNSILPFAYVFKKKSDITSAITHQFALYYQNWIISFALPLNVWDLQSGLYNKGNLRLSFCPPLSSMSLPKGIFHQQFIKDFSSLERVLNEHQELTFAMDKIDTNELMSIDPVTGKTAVKHFDKNLVKGLFIFKNTDRPQFSKDKG